MGRTTTQREQDLVPHEEQYQICAQCERRLLIEELFWNLKRGHRNDWILHKGEYRCRDAKACRRARRVKR